MEPKIHKKARFVNNSLEVNPSVDFANNAVDKRRLSCHEKVVDNFHRMAVIFSAVCITNSCRMKVVWWNPSKISNFVRQRPLLSICVNESIFV